MHRTALLLCCLACAAHGWRVHTSSQKGQRTLTADDVVDVFLSLTEPGSSDSLRALASFLLAPSPKSAFNQLRLGARFPSGDVIFANSKPVQPTSLMQMAHTETESVALTGTVAIYQDVVIPSPAEGPPRQEVTVVDLMPHINRMLQESGLREGTVNVITRHTTCSITINEWESRLARDLKAWLLKLAPPDDRSSIGSDGGVRYLHNDIDLRPESEDERLRCLENGWKVDDPAELQRWRDQEPINAHSHLAAMLLGSSESIPVTGGQLVLGQWQSVMMVDIDGPRERKVGIQIIGFM